MTASVRLTAEAKRAAQEIRDWIAHRSPSGAERWIDALEQAVASLVTQPRMGSVAPESSVVGDEVRQMPFGTRRGRKYRLLYVIRGRLVIRRLDPWSGAAAYGISGAEAA